MDKKHNIYSPKSPSNRYVIYDQYHLGSKDHFVESVFGWNAALSRYIWWKEMKGDYVVLGLCTQEYYDHLINSYL